MIPDMVSADHRLPIAPVKDGVVRPFWSVMIPTRNRSTYLERTLRSVLAQDPGPEQMQIEVVDNCSTRSDAADITCRVGLGRISFFRQENPVSMSENWNTCVQRSKGRWVHILHDDDILLPGFYNTYERFIQEHRKLVMVCCRAIAVDENDNWLNFTSSLSEHSRSGLVENCLYRLVIGNFVCAPSAVVARTAYEKVGGFSPEFQFSPDWDMWMRLTSVGGVAYLHQPYLLYRLHPDSCTNEMVTKGAVMDDVVRAITTGAQGLPLPLQKKAIRIARQKHAAYANSLRDALHDQQQHRTALNFAFWVFRLCPSMHNLLRILRSLFLSISFTNKTKIPRVSEINLS